MLNKEEIQYNTNGLVSAWLNKYGKTTRLVIELSNDEVSQNLRKAYQSLSDNYSLKVVLISTQNNSKIIDFKRVISA